MRLGNGGWWVLGWKVERVGEAGGECCRSEGGGGGGSETGVCVCVCVCGGGGVKTINAPNYLQKQGLDRNIDTAGSNKRRLVCQ